jgi:hypothetical protein
MVISIIIVSSRSRHKADKAILLLIEIKVGNDARIGQAHRRPLLHRVNDEYPMLDRVRSYHDPLAIGPVEQLFSNGEKNGMRPPVFET